MATTTAHVGVLTAFLARPWRRKGRYGSKTDTVTKLGLRDFLQASETAQSPNEQIIIDYKPSVKFHEVGVLY